MRSILATLFATLTWGVAHAEVPIEGTEVTRSGAYTAYLIEPTTRYAHGALGDDIEAAGFAVTHQGKLRTYLLPDNQVFEDLRVRLIDLDGNDVPEAVIIRSNLTEGSSIAIYDLSQEKITLRAASEYIGLPNRWLNIVGFGDFTGDGKIMIAAVITPHLAGSLRVYEIVGESVQEVSRIDGYSNHVNGTTELDLAELRDVNGDGVIDVTLPVLGHSTLANITFKDGRPQVLLP